MRKPAALASIQDQRMHDPLNPELILRVREKAQCGIYKKLIHAKALEKFGCTWVTVVLDSFTWLFIAELL